MNWVIEFFDESIETETLALPPKILAKLLHIFDLIEIAGANLGEPYTKPLEDGLFEVRAKAHEGIGRSIYCYQKEKRRLIMQTIKRPTYKDFKAKALQNLEVKKEYENFKPLFEIKKQLVIARLNKGITQEEIAKKVGTSKSNISRLESLNNTFMPNIATLIKYANALQMKLNISLR